MNRPECAVYFPSFDGKPAVQAEVPELLLPFGLNVEVRSPVATEDNYEEWLEETGTEIDELAQEAEVDLIGASSGGKIALSLLIRHPDSVRRAVIINTKIEQFAFHNPATRVKVPNLAKTSDVLADDLQHMTPEMRTTVLSLYSRKDEVLDGSEDAILSGGHNVVMPADSHGEGIEYAVTHCGLHIARFCTQGIVPTSV